MMPAQRLKLDEPQVPYDARCLPGEDWHSRRAAAPLTISMAAAGTGMLVANGAPWA